MVGRERERDTPPIRSPRDADWDRHGRGIAHSATERRPTFRSHAAWDRMDPWSSSATPRRHGDDSPRDRSRMDSNWSRKPRPDFQQGRRFVRNDHRYDDLDRIERTDRADDRESIGFSEPSSQASSGRSSRNPPSAWDYSEPMTYRSVAPRRGSRWDVGPLDEPRSKNATSSAPLRDDSVSRRNSHSAESARLNDGMEDAKTKDRVSYNAKHDGVVPTASNADEAGAIDPNPSPRSATEANLTSSRLSHVTHGDTKTSMQKDVQSRSEAEKSASETQAPLTKPEAVSSDTQSGSSSAPSHSEKHSHVQDSAMLRQDSDQLANEAPMAPIRSPVHRPSNEHKDTATEIVTDANEHNQSSRPSSPLSAKAPTPSATGSSALSRSLKSSSGAEEDTLEREILATEKILQAAEHISQKVTNQDTEQAMHEQSTTDPTTHTHTELIRNETAKDAPEARAISVVSVAKQVFKAGKPLCDQIHDIFLENQRQVQCNEATSTALALTCAQTPLDDYKVPMEVLQRDAEQRRDAREAKESRLRAEYRRIHAAWDRYCRHLDKVYERREQQRRSMSGATQDDDNQAAPTPTLFGTPTPARGSRRGVSGSGDAVRSEAEFLEILASLENAEMQDPSARAARTAATVPDMHVHVIGDPMLIDYDDGKVADFGRMYFSEFDPDVWSEEERGTFAKRYALYPKQFGQIARGLPHKTAQQCVVYYYLHKRLPGYDFKVFGTKGRERKRKARRPKKAKGSALMADIAAGSEAQPDSEELAESDLLNQRRNEEDVNVIQQESGTTPSSNSKRARLEPSHKSPSASIVSKTDWNSSVEDAAAGLSQLAQGSEPRSIPAPQWETDRELAAAEALEALAGTTPMSNKKRVRKPKKEEDSNDHRGRSRGSHWSMTERAEFLRLLALHGKGWVALAAAFPSKTAAQTRNFFARHANESSHFQAAVNLAVNNARLPLEERSKSAVKFVNDWYNTLPEDVQSSIDGWPADLASYLKLDAAKSLSVSRDDDETDDEANGNASSTAATPGQEAPQSIQGRSMQSPFAQYTPAGASSCLANSGPQRVSLPSHAYNARYEPGASSTSTTPHTSPTAMPSARGMPEGMAYGYPTNRYAQTYREGYDRYSMYAYPGVYHPEYATHRDERHYEPNNSENSSERHLPHAYESSSHIPNPQTGPIYPPLSQSQSPIQSRSPIALRPSSAERKQGSYPRANYLQTHAESHERPDTYYEAPRPIRRSPYPQGPNYGYFTFPRPEHS
ncbi:DNA-binding protein snt1 [Malassezia yamatoensis]|uniref:DNA-binding protein snt1 n=1 Tax=Malassezia yamatoensis TaxID=253288 RepID=A0AAJ6CH14_9BASI|nr:DNA-binding protein snt1 [Malassezia yamatoensis]